MNEALLIFGVLVLAYLIGSIATSIWVSRWFFDVDIRNEGSGNAGATNTFRVLGTKAGIIVLVIDALKGWLAVQLGQWIIPMPDTANAQICLGVLAVLGHIFPVYERFKGGKGIATLLGVVLAIHPQAALLAMAAFLVILASTKWVSVASMFAAISLPLWIKFRFPETDQSILIFAWLLAVLVIFTHRKNIRRLLDGEENRVNIQFRKNKD